MPRLFTGLELPETAADALDLLRGGIEGARWVDREAYHITLRFIGDVDGTMADEVVDALDRVHMAGFSLQLAGIGHFGGDRPHSLHARVGASSALERLQGAHERACRLAGLQPCTRKFSPHVTLARLKGAEAGDVRRYEMAHGSFELPLFEVGAFVLFSARPGRGGGPYVPEARFALTAPV